MLANNEQEQGPVECRICHSRTTRDLILSPCLCKGSMGFVHTRCLEQWLNVSSHNSCELCSYRFEVIQVRRYSLLRSIRIWICQDQASVYKAIFFIVLSATNTFLLSWMWFLWLSHVPINLNENRHRNEEIGSDESSDQGHQEVTRPKWIAVFMFLTLLTLFSIKSLCFDGYRAIKTQYHAWHRWWNETVNVQLVLDLDNYKIKNKLEKQKEESKDISLKYTQEKTDNAIVNGKNTDFIDENYLNKLSQDFPEIHTLGKMSLFDIFASSKMTLDVDSERSNNVPEESCGRLEYKSQVKANSTGSITSNTSCSDILDENDDQNGNLKHIPEVHKEYNAEQE